MLSLSISGNIINLYRFKPTCDLTNGCSSRVKVIKQKSSMNNNEGRGIVPRPSPLPPMSNRTLSHPSFLPLYLAADIAPKLDCNIQTVHPISQELCFYTDPTMTCERIPNRVTDLRIFNHLQLHTPQPVMSCSAAPPRPDPFRSGLHAIRDLGSLTIKTSAQQCESTLKTNNLQPLVQPARIILQLSPEEDQTITNLLQLHHQEPIQSILSPIAEQMNFPLQHPRNADMRGQVQQGRFVSYREFEAANTLLSLGLVESAATPPESLPCRNIRSETQLASKTTDCIQKNDRRYTRPNRRSRVSLRSGVKERARSDTVEAAALALMTLRGLAALDTMQ